MAIKPRVFKRKFHVTVKRENCFLIWADDADQVRKGLEDADHDDLFGWDNEPEIYVREAFDAEPSKVTSGISLQDDGEIDDWLDIRDLPYDPVASLTETDGYTPSKEELEKAGQQQMKGLWEALATDEAGT